MLHDQEWLLTIKENFDEKGAGGSDFYYLLQTMLNEKKFTFPRLVFDASNGIGCTVHEGLSYALDQDWDHPDDFNEVNFFIGEIESSKLSVDEYIYLMKIASEAYLSFFSIDTESVKRNLERLIFRYRR